MRLSITTRRIAREAGFVLPIGRIVRALSFALTFLTFSSVAQAAAQPVSLDTIGAAYTQDFNGLPTYSGATDGGSTAGSCVDGDTPLPGWYYRTTPNATSTTPNPPPFTSACKAGNGGSNAGGVWSYGSRVASGSPAPYLDRALGSLASGSAQATFGVRLANNTRTTISALNIKYTGEQWRAGSTGAPQKLQFWYQVADAGTISNIATDGTWTAYTALDFVTPNNTPVSGGGLLDGNAAANQALLRSTLSGISVADGQEVWLRWTDTDDGGSDAGLAIDDLSITPYGDTTLFIDGNSCVEGDSGATNCTFNVSLSTPADNDVSFDIATQDAGSGSGYAVAGTDYTATTAHVTIPAGSTSYTFNVPVIGNTSIEPNRIFNVAISNISGAVAGNLVGVGTIIDDDTPSLSIDNVTQIEGDSGATAFVFTVALSKTPGSNVTVTYATRSGTASAPSDYTAIGATTMTFAAGTSALTQTIAVNVNGDTAIEGDETFYVDLSNPVNAVINTVTGTGTILNDDATASSIMAIQGQGTGSSFAGSGGTPGKLVLTPDPAAPTHLNIVTAIKSSGFYMQDNVGDNDVTTSDGIFVFTGSAPSVSIGDAVVVRGRVQEFRGSTEITGIAGQPVSVTVASSGNALPAAYDLTANPPSHDPAGGICANSAITNSSGYQARNFACLDGMLVKITNGLAVTPTSGSLSYSTTPVSDGVHPNNVASFYATADGTRPLRSAGLDWPGDSGRPDIPVYNSAPEAFQIYYGGLGFDPDDFIYNAGTTFQATGIMTGYSSSTTGGIATTYELYPLPASHPNAPGMITGGTPSYPVEVATPTTGQLTIGTQNGLHFFNDVNDGTGDSSQYTDKCLAPGGSAAGDNDQCPTTAEYQVRLEKMSRQIRLTLKAPIVQVIQEVENYNTLAALADRIHADDPTLTYVPYSIRGNDPGGINIGILVRDGVTVDSVTQFYRDTQVNDACNPSFPKPCLLNDRPPVLLDASYQGYRFRVLAIYHRSLGSLAKTGYVGQKRMEQAVQVAGLIQALQTTGQSAVGNTRQSAGGVSTDSSFPVDGNATIPLVVLGDFNAYEFNDGYVDVTGIIMGTAATSSCPSYYCPSQTMDIGTYVAPSPAMFDTGTAADPNNGSVGPYSYTFNAFAQEIDHIVISDRAHEDFVRISHAHGNADATDSAIPSNPYGSLVLDPTTAMRTSDHDGQVVTLGYVVTATAGGGASVGTAGNSTAQATVGNGGGATFTFIADTGHHFSGASDTCGAGGGSGGSFDSASGVYTVSSVTADCSVTVLAAADTYTLTYTAGAHGTVDGLPTETQTVSYGGSGSAVTAIPATGYHFTQWSDASTDNPRTDTNVSTNINVTAAFALNTYHVSPNVGAGGGGMNPSVSQTIDYNGTATFQLVAEDGHHVANAYDDCGPGGSNSNPGYSGGDYTTGPITADCTVSAVFSINSYLVKATVSGGGGSVTPTTRPGVTHGSTTTFTAEPDPGHSLASVSGCGASAVGNAITTGAITDNCTVTLSFMQVVGYVPLNPSRILDTRAGANTSDGQFAAGGALAPEQTLGLTVLGRGGVPASGVKAVVLNLTVTAPTAPGYITAWPSGTQKPATSNLNFIAGQTIPNLVIAEVGGDGKVALFNSDGNTQLVADVQGYFTDAADLTAVAPARLLDTRANHPTDDGLFAGLGPVVAGDATKVNLTVAGRGGLPNSGVGTVILNVTVTNPTAPAFVTVWPTDNARPPTSNLNFMPGQTIANLVVSKVSVDGHVSLYNSGGNTDLIADVMGWFPVGSELTSLQPARVLDNRPTGTTVDGQFQHGGPLGPASTLEFIVAGRGNVPASGVGAVVLNVTVTGPSAAGYLTAWPTGSARPIASNLNFVAGQTIPNLVIVKVGDQGKVSLFNSQGSSYVIADVVGWFPATE